MKYYGKIKHVPIADRMDFYAADLEGIADNIEEIRMDLDTQTKSKYGEDALRTAVLALLSIVDALEHDAEVIRDEERKAV